MSLARGTIRYKCLAPNCKNAFYYPIKDVNYKNKHFFRFPKNEEKRLKWFSNLKLPYNDYKKGYICEDHFSTTSFSKAATDRMHLLRDAVPMFLSKCHVQLEVHFLNPSDDLQMMQESSDDQMGITNEDVADIFENRCEQSNNKLEVLKHNENLTPKENKLNFVIGDSTYVLTM